MELLSAASFTFFVNAGPLSVFCRCDADPSHLAARADPHGELPERSDDELMQLAHAAAPTRGELLRVGREIADQVRDVTSQGGAADVYFVFAGHGDVDQGSGFIELADARFSSSDLEHWLRAIPFSRGHVILDSCNSFFMLATRKPGGRYYATSEDASRTLAARLPNVGVFLSTSAEGDAFEWSEIQSGVFSHIVRSGLLGAADADSDGRIDYLELAAFVATATADVANPNMRPHVFARGPGGHDDVAIVDAAGRTGARTLHVADAAASRIRLRDREGIPFLDAHSESGLATVLANGPHAVTHYRAQLKLTAAPVFGVSREDAERMTLLLDQIESAEHDQRMRAGALYVALGGYYGLLGASMLSLGDSLPDTTKKDANIAGAAFFGLRPLDPRHRRLGGAAQLGRLDRSRRGFPEQRRKTLRFALDRRHRHVDRGRWDPHGVAPRVADPAAHHNLATRPGSLPHRADAGSGAGWRDAGS